MKRPWANDLVGPSNLRAVAVLLVAASLFPGAIAGETVDRENLPWTAGEGRVTLSDQTIQEARDQARRAAEKDAIENATGSFSIRASDDYLKQETGDSLIERFSRTIRREISGRIVDIRHVDIDQEEPAPDVLQIICRLEARVAVEKQERNSAFEVRVDLHGNETGIFRAGEELVLEIRSSLDCWVTVFNVYADGTAAVLLPNARMPDNRVTADDVFLVPDHGNPTQKFIHFRLALPENQKRTEEYIAVVATLREFSFLSNTLTDYGQGYIPAYEAAVTELNNWILQIPRNERAEAEVFYSIFE